MNKILTDTGDELIDVRDNAFFADTNVVAIIPTRIDGRQSYIPVFEDEEDDE